MAKHIRNLTFHMLKSFFSLSPIGSFSPSWFPIGWHLHFSLRIRIAKNTPKSHIMYYPHHEGARGSPMHIHDVGGKSVINYPHHACAEFIANRFHEEYSRALRTS
jgi:hypothetical protein